VNYLSMLAHRAPSFVVPLIVLSSVPAATNASFYIAWAVTAVVCLVPEAIGQVLVVEGDRGNRAVASQARLALSLSLGLTVAAAAAAWALQGLVVRIYGAEYHEAARIMPLLVTGSIPFAVTSIALAEARVRRDPLGSVVIPLVLALAVVVPAGWLIPAHGINGAAAAWLIGNAVGCATAVVMLRSSIRVRWEGRAGFPAPAAVSSASAAVPPG
jgi:O-antigen/teichoic acid export membrane protein